MYKRQVIEGASSPGEQHKMQKVYILHKVKPSVIIEIPTGCLIVYTEGDRCAMLLTKLPTNNQGSVIPCVILVC